MTEARLENTNNFANIDFSFINNSDLDFMLGDLNWDSEGIVETSRGTRHLFTAPVSSMFWSDWKEHKETLKSAGISCTKDPVEGWVVQYWKPVDAAKTETVNKETEVIETAETTNETSKSVDEILEQIESLKRADGKYSINRTIHISRQKLISEEDIDILDESDKVSVGRSMSYYTIEVLND